MPYQSPFLLSPSRCRQFHSDFLQRTSSGFIDLESFDDTPSAGLANDVIAELEKTVHLDGPADTIGDGLIRARAGDAMLVVPINPYASRTLELAMLAREKGLNIVAITDSEVSPLVGIADAVIL